MLISGGYAKQTRDYKEVADFNELESAFYWAEKRGVSRTGRFWMHLLSEQDRLEREHQARLADTPPAPEGDRHQW